MIFPVIKINQRAATNPKRITILGSTGTIGKNTIKLIEESGGAFQVEALTARNNVTLLADQAVKLRPEIIVIENKSLYGELKSLLDGVKVKIEAGSEAVCEAAKRNCDIVISGIVGAAALAPTLAAIKQGHVVGLANKECLVSAGDIMRAEVKKSGAVIIPVDSEHNSVFQCLDSAHKENLEKITLTASGGPFRNFTREMMKTVTVEQAVSHPNWAMGEKISVDSATMMNKGLEVIEAFHLFELPEDKIDVLVHPESVIHSLISFKDGSVIAGMSVPDMCVPISYALGWPDRITTKTPRLDLAAIGNLSFMKPDEAKFPALGIARNALRTGGTATTILNAANEVAVNAFINKKIGFLDITSIVEKTLDRLPTQAASSLGVVLEADSGAREAAEKFIGEIKI